MYIRFVAAAPSQNAYLATGVFTTTKKLIDDGRLEPYEVDVLEETFEWFNTHLPCPPFARMRESNKWSRNAVAWFRHDAKPFITRMWDLVALLKEHGEPVRFVQTDRPGQIVYSDEFQIVAETPRRWVKEIRAFTVDTDQKL